MTPSSTAWPPTSVVSSPLSRTGSIWVCANRRRNRENCTGSSISIIALGPTRGSQISSTRQFQLQNRIGDLGEVPPHDIRSRKKWKQSLARPGHKSSRAARPHGSSDVPGVGRNHAELAGWNTQRIRDHPIGAGRGLVSVDTFDRKVALEVLPQARILDLSFQGPWR